MSKNFLLKKLLGKKKKKTTILDKILFAILAIGLIMMIIFFAYLFWFNITNRSVANYLPSEDTIAYFELEDIALPPKLSKSQLFDITGLETLLTKTFGLEITDIQDYILQGRFGSALVKNDNGTPEPILFFRANNKTEILEHFKNLGLKNEKLTITGNKENIIYSYPRSRHFAFSFIDSYIFIAHNNEVLKQIQSVKHKINPSLNEDDKYLKTLANLPRQSWGRIYIDIQNLEYTSTNTTGQLIIPLKYLLNHLSVAIRKQPDGFHFNSLLSINPELLALKKGFVDNSRFTYGLADFTGSKNIALYVGGANLADEWENTLNTISNMNPAYGIIIEGILRAQISKFFGDNVSLRDDLYPLFKGEYALFLENMSESKGSKLGVKVILKHNDMNFIKSKMKKLHKGFSSLAAQYAPKLKVFSLPDGTESRELVADATRLDEINENYKDYEINCVDVTGSSFGFCYSVTDQLVILSNNINSIKETIDLTTSPKFVLSQSQGFRKTLSNLSAVSDEISFVQFDNSNELLKNTKLGLFIKKLTNSFSAVSWIKHYFDDGVSTEGYLLFK